MDKSILFAFDSDLTLVDVDSDLAVIELGEPLPQEIKDLYDGHYWTKYMNAVYGHLHRQGVSLDRITERIDSIPLVKGMSQVVTSIHQMPGAKIVIVSDSNDFVISKILSRILGSEEAASLVPLVTNKTYTSAEGCLGINPYETQWDCHFCPQNLCKGAALGSWIQKNGPFKQVVYIGDGKNDICPVIRLTENDMVFARRGFALERIIKEGESRGKKVNVEARVKYWDTGFDILNQSL